MKNKFILLILCGLLVVFAPAKVFGEIKNNNCYNCTIDSNLTDFDNGKYWIQKITYKNGETTTINPVDKFSFIMINNNFIPNVDIQNEYGYSLAPVRIIVEELGGQVEWDEQKNTASIEYKNNKIKMSTGDKNAVINDRVVVLPIAVQMIDDRMNAPLRALAEIFRADISYNIDIMPFGNPLISIDTRTKKVTKEEAVKLASDAMERAYKTFLKNNRYVDGSDTSNIVLNEIRQKIDDIEYKDELAGYWILKGPYEILVDKSTGDLLFKYGTNGNGGSGSYAEGICSVNVNDLDVFVAGYFAG
ncbi:hypothetical protein N752_27365 [Desulforamulus aquiferis]|nr:stalk domain-containing protein [Desulforamulus aquiferis]RYD02174.1 hypothetical protein N752_27365 [Desulforamulus aquiferis]